jgi:hypothetical protein
MRMADDRMQENEYSLKLRLQNILVGRDNEIEQLKCNSTGYWKAILP